MVNEKSAGALILRKEGYEVYYLLLHYASGHWEFVKGHIEKGEEELETVKRETEEETGIKDLQFIDGFKESITYFYRRKKETVNKEVIFYLAETKIKDVKISFEHIGFDWLNYEDALKRLTFKNAKDILEKANKIVLQKV